MWLNKIYGCLNICVCVYACARAIHFVYGMYWSAEIPFISKIGRKQWSFVQGGYVNAYLS